MRRLLLAATCLSLLTGCTVVSANRSFPALRWYWSADAKAQRTERKAEKAADAEWARTNSVAK